MLQKEEKQSIIETYAIDYIDTKRAEEYVTIIEIPVSGII